MLHSFIYIVLPAIALIAVAFLALGCNIFFRRNGRFPETEVGRNRKIRKLGITCPRCDENHTWRKMKNKGRTQINLAGIKIDTTALP